MEFNSGFKGLTYHQELSIMTVMDWICKYLSWYLLLLGDGNRSWI